VGTYMISASNGAITLPLQNVATGSPVTLDFTGN